MKSVLSTRSIPDANSKVSIWLLIVGLLGSDISTTKTPYSRHAIIKMLLSFDNSIRLIEPNPDNSEITTGAPLSSNEQIYSVFTSPANKYLSDATISCTFSIGSPVS